MTLPCNGTDSYEVIGDRLVRTVTPARGNPYRHICTLAVYQRIAHAVDEHAEQGVTSDMLFKLLDLPHTQIVVALEFMKERGCITTPFRRAIPASSDVYLDAMTEWHALRELGNTI